MKGATVRPATVPALVLCAALMTSAGAVRAGGEPVVPFPGTSVPGTSVSGALEDGGGKSAGSPPPPALDAEAAGLAMGATAAGAEPEPSDEAAPDAGAEAAGVAVPPVDAGPSDAAVPGGKRADEKPETPMGGSRLLRALAKQPISGAVPAEAARSGAPRGFVAEGCPRALLRRLLAGAAGEADALSALGIEREILTLCRERQEIVAGLFETEVRLSELREAARPPEPETRVTAASAVPAPRLEAAGEAPAVARTAASPLRAALGGAEEQANEAVPRIADTRAADTRAAEPQAYSPVRGNSPVQAPAQVSLAQASPRYAWFSIIGTAGALRAGVSDGTGVWFVREGDALPGGATITAIAGRPPAVRVTGAGESGEATLLPFRARPGAGP